MPTTYDSSYVSHRFTILLPNGQPDYTVEFVNGRQVRKVRVNRPKALCFDYRQLKDTFGLDLETEVITDVQEFGEENNEISASDTHMQRDLPF